MKLGWHGSETSSAEETMVSGISMSKYLEIGDVLTLTGELGSGKTTFIKGILRGFNYSDEVTSPTFTLINEYDAIFPIIHIDCYREDNLDRWVEIGIHDYLNGENIIIIEWADKISSLLPTDSIKIEFIHKGYDKRKINFYN